jgi:hypothetical protein
MIKICRKVIFQYEVDLVKKISRSAYKELQDLQKDG